MLEADAFRRTVLFDCVRIAYALTIKTGKRDLMGGTTGHFPQLVAATWLLPVTVMKKVENKWEEEEKRKLTDLSLKPIVVLYVENAQLQAVRFPFCI